MINILTADQKKKIIYLKQLKFLDKKIDRNILELEKWKSRACKIITVISDMPKAYSPTDSMADNIANIIDLNNQINADIDNYTNFKNEILNKIKAVDDDRLRNILEDRYINYWTWEEIAWKNSYGWRWVYKLHEKALNEIKIM